MDSAGCGFEGCGTDEELENCETDLGFVILVMELQWTERGNHHEIVECIPGKMGFGDHRCSN